tara:strand:- start:791 stop:1513 length:723 start_codon:yes stop_codon:yes gene_type:complete
MPKISSYPIQDIIVGTDKVIGSDAINDMATKNFTFNDIAVFLNTNNKVECNALRYKYQNWVTGDERLPGSISFSKSNIGSPAFSSISSFMLSKFMLKSNIDVSSYYSVPLIASTVLISQTDNPSNFGVYNWNSATQDAIETNFYDIGVTFRSGAGNLINDKDYFISLLTYGGTNTGDKNYVYPQDIAANPWIINHGLNKYPSVSVVNSALETVYGDVDYDSLNVVTITFNGAQTGKAFFN